MNFNEFLAHAKKHNDVPLDRLAKEVGAHMVLYPETCMKVIEKALEPVYVPDGFRWCFLGACLNEGMALDMAVVIATNPGCLKLLGRLPEIRDDADKGYGLAVRNGLDIDELFLKFFDFEEYWRENGGETITTLYGVYMIDTKEISKKYKELASC